MNWWRRYGIWRHRRRGGWGGKNLAWVLAKTLFIDARKLTTGLSLPIFHWKQLAALETKEAENGFT
jgi:hypothetical protein